MRNNDISKIESIFFAVKKLPFFSLDDLASMETNKTYLKISFSRYEKSGQVIRLKRGLYVASDYLRELKEHGRFSAYLELLANIIYEPSYLSLEYILYQHNLLTDIPVNITSITTKKTSTFSNNLGNLLYRTVKEKLFCGFETLPQGGFSLRRARKAKALFDYLYLRKHDILGKESFEELRINWNEFDLSDRNELTEYVALEGSIKMRELVTYIPKI